MKPLGSGNAIFISRNVICMDLDRNVVFSLMSTTTYLETEYISVRGVMDIRNPGYKLCSRHISM